MNIKPEASPEPLVIRGAAAAAKAAGISRSALYAELKAGRIVGRKYGRRRFSSAPRSRVSSRRCRRPRSVLAGADEDGLQLPVRPRRRSPC